MFCPNCGASTEADAKFCNNCGTTVTAEKAVETAAPPVVASAAGAGLPDLPVLPASRPAVPPVSMMAPAGKPKKSMVPIIAAVAGLVVIIIVAAIVIVSRFGPTLAVGRAMGNFNEELMARIETTPFQAFPMLFNTLDNGTVHVEFDWWEEWEDWWTGTRQTSEASGTMSFASNARRGEFAFRGDFEIDRDDFGFSAYINRDRIALGSPQVGREYYGFRYATFREDIRPFGRTAGLTSREMDEMSDFVEWFGESMANTGGSATDEFDEYTSVLIDLLLASETVTDRVDIRVGRETVSARRVSYEIDDTDFIRLLGDWLEIFENDENMVNAFNIGAGDFGMDHRATVRELRSALRDVERELRGSTITLSFYIGRRDRLLRIDLDANLRIAGERIRFDARLDLGESATDTWRLEFNVEDLSLEVIWEFRESGARLVNTIEVTNEDRWGRNTNTLTIDWNPSSGAFFLEAEERGRWGTDTWELLRGNFTVRGNDFVLELENYNDWGWSRSELDIIIRTETGNANTGGNMSFINIDQWDQRLINRVEDLLWDLGW